jgi:hypothetical protein
VRLPHAPPSWLTLRRVAIAWSVSLPATLTAIWAMTSGGWVLWALSFLVFEYFVALYALGAHNEWSACRRGLVSHWAVGGLVCLVWALGCSYDHGALWAITAVMNVATFAPLSIVAIWHCVIPSMAVRFRHPQMGGGVHDLLALAGGLLVVEGLSLWGLVHDYPGEIRPVELPPLMLLATGIIAMAFGIARIVARRRWLSQVERGIVPGWRIVHAPSSLPDGLPLMRAPRVAAGTHVLVAVIGAREPFRAVENVQPVALVAGEHIYRRRA